MKNRKRWLVLSLSLVLAFVLVACGTDSNTNDTSTNDTTDTETTQTTDTDTDNQETDDTQTQGSNTTQSGGDTLRVVTSGELNGHYIAGLTNSAYDVWVRNLIWGYGVYATDEAGQFVLNETVLAGEPQVTDNEDGSKTYTFTINEGLTWSDGEAITAHDYVFGALFSSSSSVTKVGVTGGFDSLVGYDEYKAGTAQSFPGVRLVDDYTFEATISEDNVPYFYEVASVALSPSPLHVWAPNLQIGEDGSSLVAVDGYELTDEDRQNFEDQVNTRVEELNSQLEELQAQEEVDDEQVSALEEERAELEASLENPEANISETLRDSAAFYVYQEEVFGPTVSSGAYKFLNFENQVATVELNPEYQGNFRGEVPTIPRVEVRTVNEDIDVDTVINGEADIVAGVIEGEKIEKALAASDQVTAIDYKRNGYGYFGFHVDMAPVDDVNVRQALAWLMDRQAIVDGVLGGYGEVGQGMYGLSQWTYVAKGQEFMNEIENRDTVYTLNVDRANELLDQTDYVYEADGSTPWDAQRAVELAESDGDNFSYWRHNSQGQELQVNHAAGAENVGNAVNAELTPNGRLAGVHYTMSVVDFNILIENFYNVGNAAPEDRTYHAYTLASSFNPVFDPYYAFHTDWLGTRFNTHQVNDEEADRVVTELRRVDPQNPEEYTEKWLEFQLWFNNYLPQIPLYSNQYFDIYNNRITGLETTPDWDWSNDIADIEFVQ